MRNDYFPTSSEVFFAIRINWQSVFRTGADRIKITNARKDILYGLLHSAWTCAYQKWIARMTEN